MSLAVLLQSKCLTCVDHTTSRVSSTEENSLRFHKSEENLQCSPLIAGNSLNAKGEQKYTKTKSMSQYITNKNLLYYCSEVNSLIHSLSNIMGVLNSDVICGSSMMLSVS